MEGTPIPTGTGPTTPTGGGLGSGYVDTSRSERMVWLMKCPALVSRSLHHPHPHPHPHPPNDDSALPPPPPVAKVVFSFDPLADSNQVTMELAGSEVGNEPKIYSMEMSDDHVPMAAFSDSDGKIAVEGFVKNKFDMRPHNQAIESYGKLCRERTKKYSTKSRQIQVIGNEKPIIPMPGIPHIQEKKKQVVKASETKRTRRDRGEMEDIMFKLFENQPNWTLKELINKTDQPEQFMKDLLKDLCVYNNKGANQGTYELKPEYKRSIEDPIG